jgi:GAF domain-containing protein
LDNYDHASEEIAAITRQLDVRSAVGTPIVVDGHLWGVMIASSNDDPPLPADTEARIAAFTELVATAISNTEAHTELGRLAEEQRCVGWRRWSRKVCLPASSSAPSLRRSAG